MRAYVKAKSESAITLVNVESGERFSVPVATYQKLFGDVPEVGDVWDYRATRLDDVAEMFRRFEVVRSA